MSRAQDPHELRGALARARIYLVFTPELCAGRDPLGVLGSVLPWVDLIQVRPKPREQGLDPLAHPRGASVVTQARELHRWCRMVLELVEAAGRSVPVIANDRVDVAGALLAEGLAGVHLGQDDLPVEAARRQLGPGALIGLSTHRAEQVVDAQSLEVDYLGFGPFRESSTKGYARGLGSEACWVAQAASAWPVFPIGGVDVASAGELAGIGRAAVGSAILSANDPAAAARAIHGLLDRSLEA